MALLKKGSKKRNTEKKRKEVATLGTFNDYKLSKGKIVPGSSKIPAMVKKQGSLDKQMN